MNKRNRFFTGLVLSMLTLVLATGSSQAQQYDEAIEFISIKPPVSVSTDGKVEVVELFWYGCSHCFSFEPSLKNWIGKQDKNKVEIIKVPAIFRPSWAVGAKAFYTAQLLGVLDKVDQPIFDAIHLKRKNPADEAMYASIFARHGVDKKTFSETYNSFAVDSMTRKAEGLTRRYGIDGVPAMVVNGKFRTSGSIAHGHEGMLKVVDFLVGKESGK